VGQLPWQVVVSANGQTVYVANPDALALTPNGQQLWIGQNTAALVTVVDTATNTALGSINLGGTEAQSGDGYRAHRHRPDQHPDPGSGPRASRPDD
jgi:DNA-binding beta-propeller fold protein YncE